MRESPLIGPEGAGEVVDDPSSEEERSFFVVSARCLSAGRT